MSRLPDTAEARRFYDRFGSKQDWQAFYEDRARDALVRASAFSDARRVLEFGCGPGRLAERLLSRELPPAARQVGIDISATMVSLAGRRLAPFGPRARVELSDGTVPATFGRGSFDRLVSTYVLDLLAKERILGLLATAHRLLAPSGLLCVVSLTRGRTFPSSLVPTKYEVEPFDASFHLRPESEGTLEVQLTWSESRGGSKPGR